MQGAALSCALVGGALQGLALRGDAPVAVGIAGLMLHATGTLLGGRRAGQLPLLAGLVCAQTLAMSWLWGASLPGAEAKSLWVAAAPMAVHLVILVSGASAAWAVLGWRTSPATGESGVALHWWLAMWMADALRRLTPWGGDYGGLSLLMPDLPGSGTGLPVVGAQVWSWAWAGWCAVVASALVCWLRRGGNVVRSASAGLAGLLVLTVTPAREWTVARTEPLPLVAVRPHEAGDPWTEATRDRRVQQLLDTAAHSTAGAVVVTSESFFGEPPPEPPSGLWLDLMQGLAQREVHALIGMQVLAAHESGGSPVNAVVQLSPSRSAIYGKGLLAPGGEILPWRGLLNPVYERAFAQAAQGLTAAPQAWREPLFVASTSIALAVCHEVAFDADLARRARTAELLVNPSDDGWTRNAVYSHQVAAIARLRAMESAKPLLRVSEGGVSLFVSALGMTLPLAGATESLLVMPREGATPYAAWAHALAFLPWLALLGTLAWSMRSAGRNSQQVSQLVKGLK